MVIKKYHTIPILFLKSVKMEGGGVLVMFPVCQPLKIWTIHYNDDVHKKKYF